MFIIKTFADDSIVKKIYDLLLENGIESTDMSGILYRAADDITNSIWEKIVISVPLLYSLKDIVWYNLEHLPSEGEAKGRSSLKHFGTKFPTFMYQNSLIISKSDAPSLLNELEEIRRKWSNDWYYVKLVSKTDEWNGGPTNPSPVIIYEANIEKPSKYGYNPYNTFGSGIVDKSGNQLAASDIEVVLCEIDSKLGGYREEPLIKALLERMIESCKKAVKYEKGVYLDIENYDYN